MAIRINELLSARSGSPRPSNVKVVVEQAAEQINQTSPERFRVAVGMLEKALVDNPNDVHLEVALAAHMLRGVQMAWYNSGDSEAAVRKAQTMLEHALRTAPTSIAVHEAYCRLLSTTNQFSASLVACARILTLDPWNGMALYLIGLSQLKLGRFEDALATFKQADQFDTPRVSRWTWALGAGWACMLMGKPEEALPWIEKSLAITPASGRVYFLLAAVYQQLGRLDEARAATAKGLAIRPGSNAHNVRVPRENTSPIFMAADDRLVSLAVAAGLPEQ
jgi:tetratricopeptide (TPR) repeat protein